MEWKTHICIKLGKVTQRWILFLFTNKHLDLLKELLQLCQRVLMCFLTIRYRLIPLTVPLKQITQTQ